MTFNPKRVRQHHWGQSVLASLQKMPPPFSGEIMKCVICGAVEQSRANDALGWRCIELDTRGRYYICNPHLPMDDAPALQWQYLYMLAFEKIAAQPGFKPADSVIIWREDGGKVSHVNMG